MLILTHISGLFSQFGLLAYGVIFFVAFFASIILTFIAGWIWTHISYILGTKKSTFVKYKVENFRLNLIGKSNIYKVPHTKFLDATYMPAQVMPSHNRQNRRAQVSQQTSPLPPAVRTLDAFIVVQFQKPIRSSAFHLRIENDGGTSPITGDTCIDERWGLVQLSGLEEGSAFRICFNSDD